MTILKKLKSRWQIESNWQLFIILLVFACTGFTAVYIRTFVFELLGIANEDPVWLKMLVWILTVLPFYHVFLILYGTVFGQFQFFWAFSKKIFGRIIPSRIQP